MQNSPQENQPGRNRNRDLRRRSQFAKKSNAPFFIIGAMVLVTLLLIYIVAQPYLAETRRNQISIEGLQVFSNLERGHAAGSLTYDQNPPVGGSHNPVWQNCGVYTEPIANENAVHSLEHGAAWITYSPDLAADKVAELQRITRQSSFRLLSPYQGLPSPVVVSTWGYQVQLDGADDPRLALFLEKYERGPDTPEPGAVCYGGIGDPQ